ncbi:MAG: 2-oxo-4-hydroxy-4-carboxy-5-ureidoimidazoline decarboxylase [Gemmatimonadaceae bacterium]
MTLDELNTAPGGVARTTLQSCCGSASWVDAMLAERPFASVDDVLNAATRVWADLPRNEVVSAFAAHPRIGERLPRPHTGTLAAEWSAREQAAAALAAARTQQAMTDANRQYEERFGFRYLVFASSRTADELLADCRARLANLPEVELRIAAQHHENITRLRLTRLLEADSA